MAAGVTEGDVEGDVVALGEEEGDGDADPVEVLVLVLVAVEVEDAVLVRDVDPVADRMAGST